MHEHTHPLILELTHDPIRLFTMNSPPKRTIYTPVLVHYFIIYPDTDEY